LKIFAILIIIIKKGISTWVQFDGPVDSVWVENLNSALDENKTLCLSNGQRIKLLNNFRILFEVDNLENASPATISRCGIVFINMSILSW